MDTYFQNGNKPLVNMRIVSRSATYIMEELKRNDSSYSPIALLLSVNLL